MLARVAALEVFGVISTLTGVKVRIKYEITKDTKEDFPK